LDLKILTNNYLVLLSFKKGKFLDSERTYEQQGYEDIDNGILFQLHQLPMQCPYQQEPIGNSY